MKLWTATRRPRHSATAAWFALVALTVSCASAPETVSVDTAPERTESERAVLAAVQSFFTTMHNKDSTGARKILDSTGNFVSVRTNDSGQQIIRRAPNTKYLSEVATLKETYLERMWDADVRVHGPIAMVWTPYDFYVDGTFSHCGVDIFNLVKSDAGWQVTSGTYTVERTGCAESPLGPP